MLLTSACRRANLLATRLAWPLMRVVGPQSFSALRPLYFRIRQWSV